jgi:hypothetical protein
MSIAGRKVEDIMRAPVRHRVVAHPVAVAVAGLGLLILEARHQRRRHHDQDRRLESSKSSEPTPPEDDLAGLAAREAGVGSF